MRTEKLSIANWKASEKPKRAPIQTFKSYPGQRLGVDMCVAPWAKNNGTTPLARPPSQLP